MAEVQEHHEATDLPLDMLVHLAEYCHLVTIGKYVVILFIFPVVLRRNFEFLNPTRI